MKRLRLEILPLMIEVWELRDVPMFLVTVNLSRFSTWGQGRLSIFSSEVIWTVSWKGSPVPTWVADIEASAEISASVRDQAIAVRRRHKARRKVFTNPSPLPRVCVADVAFAGVP